MVCYSTMITIDRRPLPTSPPSLPPLSHFPIPTILECALVRVKRDLRKRSVFVSVLLVRHSSNCISIFFIMFFLLCAELHITYTRSFLSCATSILICNYVHNCT